MKETRAAFELMKDASSLGSIMKFDLSAETRAAMEKATAEWEKKEYLPEDIATAVQSMKVILALTDKYSAAVMNPPYMGSSKFDSVLSNYVESTYQGGKTDLFAVFMIVAMHSLIYKGKMGMINMQSWMFLSSFEDTRHNFLNNYHFDSLLHLGPRTFDELSGEVVQNVAFVLTNAFIQGYAGGEYYRLVSGKSSEEKENIFLRTLNTHEKGILYPDIKQSEFISIPGSILGYWAISIVDLFKSYPSLRKIEDPSIGMMTWDNDRFLREWYEVKYDNIGFAVDSVEHSISSGKKWFPYNKGGIGRKWYGMYHLIVNWQNGGQEIFDSGMTSFRGKKNYFKEGITFPRIGSSFFCVRVSPKGFIFDINGPSCFPTHNNEYELMAYLNSSVVRYLLSIFCPTLTFQVGDIFKVPYILLNPQKAEINSLVTSSINLSREDWDAHETSWDFKVNELVRIYRGENSGDGLFVNANRLEDVVTLYKEHWTEQFNKLHANEEELNRQFIEIYGLQDELTPDVPLNEITILQNGEISIVDNKIVWHDDVIIKQLISYAIGCWMGRYRLDKEGLYIAHRPSDDEICTYDYNGFKFEIDDDAIIPLMGKDNPFEDDNALQKCINFLKYVFGGDSFLTKNMNYVEHCLGKPLEDYLIKDFWKDHKKMYQNRPIYWLFASKKGAFQVLTYMHRMNPYTVERIRTKYLLPYIEYLKGRIEVDEARGADLSTVERKNLQKMKTALEECNEYHDRLHEVAIKAIDFDLDDGVVVNYAKFGDVLAKIK